MRLMMASRRLKRSRRPRRAQNTCVLRLGRTGTAAGVRDNDPPVVNTIPLESVSDLALGVGT